MKDRLLAIALAVAFLAMALLFGVGARESVRSLERDREYPQWIEQAGRLRSVTLHQSLSRLRWRWAVACEYVVVVAGEAHAGATFDLRDPRFAELDEAKAFVESALGLQGRARWEAVRKDGATVWKLDAPDLPIRVRHSPRDPSVATLTATPPPSAALGWVVVIVLGGLAALTSLGTLAMLAAAVRPEAALRTGSERALGDDDLPPVASAVTEGYRARLGETIAAMEALREAEGSCEAWDAVLSDLRDELEAAQRGSLHQRRHGLSLSRKLDLGCVTPAQVRLQDRLGTLEAYVRDHLVAAERGGGL